MNSDTGDIKRMGDFASMLEAQENGYKPLHKEGTVLEIFGNSFLVESYDVDGNKMILRGISKQEAREKLLRNSNS